MQKKDTNMREAIPAGQRLSLTLRFLATGESYASLHYQFRVSVPSICRLVPEVCDVIYNTLKSEYLKFPESEEDWLKIATGFEEKWQLPHCVGAADGKHIRIIHPPKSGSEFYNYKGFFSIVLMAVVDADYNFIFADVGCQGRISDGGVMKNTIFWKKLVNNALHLPEPTPLPLSLSQNLVDDERIPVPYFLAGDDAFSLEPNVMKPFAQRALTDEKRIFNYRLSRGRRVSENVFGILTNRFRVFSTLLSIKPDNVTKVVLATLALHNFLRSTNSSRYIPPGSVDSEDQDGEVRQGSWRNEELISSGMVSISNSRKGRQSVKAEDIRQALCEYFNNEGQVPWQWNVLV